MNILFLQNRMNQNNLKLYDHSFSDQIKKAVTLIVNTIEEFKSSLQKFHFITKQLSDLRDKIAIFKGSNHLVEDLDKILKSACDKVKHLQIFELKNKLISSPNMRVLIHTIIEWNDNKYNFYNQKMIEELDRFPTQRKQPKQ